MGTVREKIILNYIDGYNEFNVEKMTQDFDDGIIFQNIQNGVNMTLTGKRAFIQQAEETKSYFESRHQKITKINHHSNQTEIEIEYSAVLNIDLPNELKKVDKIELKGKSIFIFSENKIAELTDIS